MVLGTTVCVSILEMIPQSEITFVYPSFILPNGNQSVNNKTLMIRKKSKIELDSRCCVSILVLKLQSEVAFLTAQSN